MKKVITTSKGTGTFTGFFFLLVIPIGLLILYNSIGIFDNGGVASLFQMILLFAPFVYGAIVLLHSKSNITVYEDEIKGMGFINYVVPRKFNFEYKRIKEVSSQGKEVLVIYSDTEKIACRIANAESVSKGINQIIQQISAS